MLSGYQPAGWLSDGHRCVTSRLCVDKGRPSRNARATLWLTTDHCFRLGRSLALPKGTMRPFHVELFVFCVCRSAFSNSKSKVFAVVTNSMGPYQLLKSALCLCVSACQRGLCSTVTVVDNLLTVRGYLVQRPVTNWSVLNAGQPLGDQPVNKHQKFTQYSQKVLNTFSTRL